MSLRRKPTALLLDLDGVLRHYPAGARNGLEEAAGLAEGEIFAVASVPELLLPAMLGRVSRAQWRTRIAAALTDRVGGPVAAEALVEAWDTYRGEIDPAVLGMVAELRTAGVPVALCTNATDEVRADLTAFGLDGAFDAVVSSAEIGAVKPMREFYEAACAAVDRPAAECLLVDDTERNIAGARAAGLLGYRYTGPSDLGYIRAALTV